jgi:hypothetical protein
VIGTSYRFSILQYFPPNLKCKKVFAFLSSGTSSKKYLHANEVELHINIWRSKFKNQQCREDTVR